MITGRVLNEVLEERREIVDSIARPAGADAPSLEEWQALLSSYHARLQLQASMHDLEACRRTLVELAAASMAAVEGIDRSKSAVRSLGRAAA